jgi:hypothetical protein
LADRILSRLATEPASAAVDSTIDTLPMSTQQDVEPATSSIGWRIRRTGQTLWTRRGWVAAGLATAAALFVATTLYLRPEPYSPERLLEAVREFDGTFQPQPGELVAATPPPSAYRLSGRILASPATTWSHLSGLLGRRGVAYQLHAPGGARATLYVVKLAGLPNDPVIAASRLPSAPPGRPQPASGGATMAAWQENGRLYVLVVHGDENAYRRFILPAQPIA